MKNLIIGDIHADIDNLEKLFGIAVLNDCDKIFQLGDFGVFPHLPEYSNFLPNVSALATKFNIPLYFIKGNHDNHEILCKYTEITELHPNVFFIPNCVKFEIDGISVIGVGGAYSIDKHHRKEGVDWWRDEEISTKDVYEAMRLGFVDIILSHDAPVTSNIDDYCDFYPIAETWENRRKLQAIVDEVCPKMLIHGHYHRNLKCVANFSINENVVYFPSNCLGANVNRLADQYYILDTDKFKEEFWNKD